MQTEELKPCPFCGNDVEIEHERLSQISKTKVIDMRECAIQCHICSSDGTVFKAIAYNSKEKGANDRAEKEVIALWNLRQK